MIAIKVCRERGGRRGEYPDVRVGMAGFDRSVRSTQHLHAEDVIRVRYEDRCI